jgi:hypothetical protein
MTEPTNRSGEVSVHVAGSITGPVAGVNYGTQIQKVDAPTGELTVADRAALGLLIDVLRARVAEEVPPDKRALAVERVAELQAAVATEKPDQKTLTKMEYVRDWFLENLPGLAGAVTSIVVHPIVGKLVATAGDSLVAEFQRRFPVE